MKDKINEALKQFNREDLIDDGYERDLDSNIEVFLTIKQMIYYSQLQSNWNSLRECIKNEIKKLLDIMDKDKIEGFELTVFQNAINRYKFVLDKMNELEGKDKE